MYRFMASLLLLASSQSILAQEQNFDMSELEIELANPLAYLPLVPLQLNYNFAHDDSTVVNTVSRFQPVFALNSDQWTFVNRFIAPYITSETTKELVTTQASGFGDVTYQLYITPKHTSGVILGGGFLLSMPTGMGDTISSGKWGAGPTFSIISATPMFTMGALLYQNWSIAGDNDRAEVNLLTIQPIFSYRLGNLWSISPFNDITLDSTLDGQKWNVPLGLQVSKLLVRPFVPLQLTAGVFSNVISPKNAPDWSMKFQMTLIL